MRLGAMAAMGGNEVTLGEVYRTLKRQDSVLDEIREEVKKTNGTVGKHETRISILEAASRPDMPAKPRTGLTIALTGPGSVAAWEVLKKFFGW